MAPDASSLFPISIGELFEPELHDHSKGDEQGMQMKKNIALVTGRKKRPGFEVHVKSPAWVVRS